MEIELTKWEREILHEIFGTVSTGTLAQVEQDMGIMKKLEISEDEYAKVFMKDVFTGKDIKTLNDILSKLNLGVRNILEIKGKVPEPKQADEITKIDLSIKEIRRLCYVAKNGEGYPRQSRTLKLKKRIEGLIKKLEG